MDQLARLRDAQLALGLGYLLVDAGAMSRNLDLSGVAASVAVSIFSYLTGRTLPPVEISFRELWGAVGVGVIVAVVAAIFVVLAPPSEMLWGMIVTSYCCANRFRAGGLFRSRDE